MNVSYKKLKPKTITYRGYKPFLNEVFIVESQKRIFYLIFLKQLLMKLFNDSDIFDKKKTKVTPIEKEDVSTGGQSVGRLKKLP